MLEANIQEKFPDNFVKSIYQIFVTLLRLSEKVSDICRLWEKVSDISKWTKRLLGCRKLCIVLNIPFPCYQFNEVYAFYRFWTKFINPDRSFHTRSTRAPLYCPLHISSTSFSFSVFHLVIDARNLWDALDSCLSLTLLDVLWTTFV